MTKRITSYIFLALAGLFALAQVPQPAKAQSEPIAIMNGIAHLGNGQVIQNSIITFDKGKITNVVDATLVRMDLKGYKQIDASGKHIYPGLILPSSQLGLVEIGAVRATRDFSEVGDFNPHVRSLIAYNTDSELIATLRFNGIQLAQVAPTSGRITGTSSIMMLDGWNWEDAVYKKDDGIHINWPALSFGPRWWMGETERRENKDYKAQIDALKSFIEEAKSYHEAKPTTANLRFEAMKGVLDGSQTVFVNVDGVQEIIEAVRTLKGLGLSKVVIVGGGDAWRVTELLKDNNIAVLARDTHSLPRRADEDVDIAYKMPLLLAQAGIKVGLLYSDELHKSRNLAFLAGTVVAYGADREEALKMITSNTAEILGIADRTGTLEAGKDANIVVSAGDLLDMRGNNVTHSFIQGKEVELPGKQQRLYERFKEKYSE
jgi:imidazolonepropionase-like amidohydrolase